MRIIHLHHSGVLIETENEQIFIDCISNVEQFIDVRKKIYFFVTHGHKDHFDEQIFNYQLDQVTYVLSDDVDSPIKNNIAFVSKNHTYDFDDIHVEVYGSTDRGVSFLITIDDKRIFHSGDLNWWHWENDDYVDQLEEERQYKMIVESIPNDKIDVAFVPVDPRLKSAFHWAAAYMLKEKRIGRLIPIHFDKEFDVCVRLQKKLNDDPRLVRVNDINEFLFEI